MVFDMKPVIRQVGHLGGKFVRDVFLLHPLTQLHPSTTNFCYFVLAWLGTNMEEMIDKIEMVLDTQDGFHKDEQTCKDEQWSSG